MADENQECGAGGLRQHPLIAPDGDRGAGDQTGCVCHPAAARRSGPPRLRSPGRGAGLLADL